MHEAEMKVLNAIDETNAKQAQQERLEKLAEVAAVSGAFSDAGEKSEIETTEPRPEDLSLELKDTSFNISFVPFYDPDVYKPLEIISYVGMTK